MRMMRPPTWQHLKPFGRRGVAERCAFLAWLAIRIFPRARRASKHEEAARKRQAEPDEGERRQAPNHPTRRSRPTRPTNP
eukprot:402587-Alexandrium_andersonii.AAC.1